jgi:hypothetical protein
MGQLEAASRSPHIKRSGGWPMTALKLCACAMMPAKGE